MNSKQQLIIFFTTLTVLICTYFLCIHFLLIPQDKQFRYSYRQFLLENTPSPRIILQAGSNVQHGINPLTIEQTFGLPTISVADTATVPLSHKIYLLLRYIKPGDIVVLPLEWQYYSEQSTLAKPYLKLILDDRAAHYYHALPFYEKLQVVFFDLPLNAIMSRLRDGNKNIVELGKEDNTANIFREYLGYNLGSRGDFLDDKSKPTDQSPEDYHCDGFIFSEQINNGWKLSTQFLKNIQLLRKLKNRGANIIFMPPTVVGKECYSTSLTPQYSDFFASITSHLQSNNFIFLGQPKQNSYDKKYFRDTPYHLNIAGQKLHTQKVIGNLSSLITPARQDIDYNALTSKTIANSISSNIRQINDKLLSQLIQWNGQNLNPSQFDRYLFTKTGWSFTENWGKWSIGYHSEIIFHPAHINKQIKTIQLKLHGRYFGEKERSKVYINGRYLGEYDLTFEKITLPAAEFRTSTVIIRLEHHNPQSPMSLTDSSDSRLLKYGLERLSWARKEKAN